MIFREAARVKRNDIGLLQRNSRTCSRWFGCKFSQ